MAIKCQALSEPQCHEQEGIIKTTYGEALKAPRVHDRPLARDEIVGWVFSMWGVGEESSSMIDTRQQ